MSKLLVVVGATGNQGGSVIRAVLNDAQLKKEFTIRAITRDPTSDQAEQLKKLTSGGVPIEVVKADTSDADLTNLIAAFKGAHTVFAATISVYDGHTYDHEFNTGKHLGDAAVSAGVKYLIYSTLPDAIKISNGKYKEIVSFNGRVAAEQYIRSLSAKGLRSAFVSPASFFSNYSGFTKPRPKQGEPGVFSLANFIKPDYAFNLIDLENDYGAFVAVILSDEDRYEGKVLLASSGLYSYQQVTAAISKSTGKKVVYDQLPAEIWKSFLPPNFATPMYEMYALIEEFGIYGKIGDVNDLKEGSLGWSIQQVKNRGGKLTTFEEFLERNPIDLE